MVYSTSTMPTLSEFQCFCLHHAHIKWASIVQVLGIWSTRVQVIIHHCLFPVFRSTAIVREVCATDAFWSHHCMGSSHQNLRSVLTATIRSPRLWFLVSMNRWYSVMPIGETPTRQKCFCFWWYWLPTLSQPACPDQVCLYGAKGTCTTSEWQRLVLSAAPGRAANARVTRNAMVGAAQIPGTSQYLMASQWKFHWISFAFQWKLYWISFVFKTNCQDMEDEVHFNPVLLD